MNVARSTALAQLLFVAASFARWSRCTSLRFSLVNVFENSHSQKPLTTRYRRVGQP